MECVLLSIGKVDKSIVVWKFKAYFDNWKVQTWVYSFIVFNKSKL